MTSSASSSSARTRPGWIARVRAVCAGPDEAAAAHDVGVHAPGLERRREHAYIELADPLEAAEMCDRALERADPAPEIARLELVVGLGERRQAAPEPVEDRTVEQVVELLGAAPLERPGGSLGLCAAPERAVRGGERADDDALATAMEVDVPLRLGRAGVRGRAKLADQPHLLERRGQLGARRAATRRDRAGRAPPRRSVAGVPSGSTTAAVP